MLPSGAVTFLFTDIEGSTRLWEKYADEMRTALARHDALVRDAVSSSGGHVFKTMGDAFCVAFADPSQAVAGAIGALMAIAGEPWPAEVPIRIRVAVHTGTVECRENDYFGKPLNRAARLLAIGRGGQALVSQTTFDLVRDLLPKGVAMIDLGEHQLKDLERSEHVYQLQHAGLKSDFPPLRSLSSSSPKHNLPPQMTSFVGREREMGEVAALLGKARLLTLTGAGGSGKTRLSLQAAAEALERFSDGAWYVELAPVTDPALVPQMVGSALGIQEETGKSVEQTLLERLKHKEMLILLDNCEHILGACAHLADKLVRHCSKLCVVATSRESLGIDGERTYRVPSMLAPDPRSPTSAEKLGEYEAVRLFVDRAETHLMGFKINSENAAAIASICHRLDGIPLAIELAAARIRSLSVSEIDDRLDQRFRLLTGGSRTALPRQQTLRALVDWSYDLLDDSERMVLRRLSTFHGGWSLEAAEPVCAGEAIEEWQILDLLSALTEKSLVFVEERAGRSRYRLLETVRQYARDRLFESGDLEAVRNRHRDYFLRLTEEAAANLFGSDQLRWFAALDADIGNIRAAMDWAYARADGVAMCRFCSALSMFWLSRKLLAEALDLCARAIEVADPLDRSEVRTRALVVASVIESLAGHFTASCEHAREALELATELGDQNLMAKALGRLRASSYNLGDAESADAYSQRLDAIPLEAQEPWHVAVSSLEYGFSLDMGGHTEAAGKAFRVALASFRSLGERRGTASALFGIGLVETTAGNHDAALACLEEASSLAIEIQDDGMIANIHNGLGIVATNLNRLEEARNHLLKSLAGYTGSNDRGLHYALQSLASLEIAEGRAERGVALWEASRTARIATGWTFSPKEQQEFDRDLKAGKALVGESACAAAADRGRAMSLETAITLARESA